MISDVYCIKNGNQRENAYLIVDNHKNTLIIDPGTQPEQLIQFIQKFALIPVGIIATHAHWDHVSAVAELSDRFKIPFALHPLDRKLLKSLNLYRWMVDKIPFGKIPNIDIPIVNEEEFKIGDFKITPFLIGSHTDGSILLLIENKLFSGDVIFKGSIAPEITSKKRKELTKIIEKIRNLADDILIYPGHGAYSELSEEYEHIKD